MSFSSRNQRGPISDINVTPLVDVVLVLLVIFMITAPLMLNGIKMNLPQTKEVNRVNLSTSQVVLSLTRAGHYYVGKNKHLVEELPKLIQEEFKRNRTDILYLRADQDIRYGRVMKLMSFLKKAGIHQIALITEIEK